LRGSPAARIRNCFFKWPKPPMTGTLPRGPKPAAGQRRVRVVGTAPVHLADHGPSGTAAAPTIRALGLAGLNVRLDQPAYLAARRRLVYTGPTDHLPPTAPRAPLESRP
jgi:hypothetical protein